MRVAEKSLLLAVRDRLRTVCGYTEQQCQIEYDEQAPAVTGDTYIIVMTGGWSPGPRHRTSGGVNDLLYAIDIGVVKRVTSVPRDRLRNVFFRNISALTEEVDKIYEAIDFDYALLDAANTLIVEETESTHGFIEPLKFTSMDRRPRLVPGELFAATTSEAAGLMRVISFGGARRITTK
jgi:hypothetical protein